MRKRRHVVHRESIGKASQALLTRKQAQRKHIARASQAQRRRSACATRAQRRRTMSSSEEHRKCIASATKVHRLRSGCAECIAEQSQMQPTSQPRPRCRRRGDRRCHRRRKLCSLTAFRIFRGVTRGSSELRTVAAEGL